MRQELTPASTASQIAAEDKFGLWLVEGPADKPYYWLCRCVCGRSRSVYGPNLATGKSKSCGCNGKGRGLPPKPVPREMLEKIRLSLVVDEVRPVPWAPGYCGTNSGLIVSTLADRRDDREFRVLMTMRHSAGYQQVNMKIGRKHQVEKVHRIIARLFLGEPLDGQTSVRHLDGNPENNSVENLSWGTHAENMADKNVHGTVSRGETNGHAKVLETDIPKIRRLYNLGFPSTAIGDAFGISSGTVYGIAKKLIWRHVT